MPNHSSDHFQGLSPVAVLQHNIIHEFENLHPNFLAYAKELIEKEKIDPVIGYDASQTSAASPFAEENHIEITEGFISFIWCIAYCLTVFHREITVKLGKNHYYGDEAEVPDKQLVIPALRLLDFAMRLRTDNEDWDTTLPNPQIYDDDQVELIEKVNSISLNAMKYVMGHEFAHIELGHTIDLEVKEGSAPLDSTEEELAAMEREADSRGIELVLEGRNENNRDTIELGILCALIGLLLYVEELKVPGYPDSDDRIGNYLESLPIDEQSHLWAVAVQGYKIWDRQFHKGLIWKSNLPTYKDVYFDIRAQLADMKKGL